VAKILSELAVPDEAAADPSYENRVLDRVLVLLKAEDAKEGAWGRRKGAAGCSAILAQPA